MKFVKVQTSEHLKWVKMEQKFKIFHEYVFIVFITLYISNETWIGATFILRLAFSAYPNKKFKSSSQQKCKKRIFSKMNLMEDIFIEFFVARYKFHCLVFVTSPNFFNTWIMKHEMVAKFVSDISKW